MSKLCLPRHTSLYIHLLTLCHWRYARKTLSNWKWLIMLNIWVPLMTSPHSLFICMLSDKRKEELELMIVEWTLGRGFVKTLTLTPRTGRRSRWSKEEEEDRKSMGSSSVWIFLLSLSLSHQGVTAQAEGNGWHSYPQRTPSNKQCI